MHKELIATYLFLLAHNLEYIKGNNKTWQEDWVQRFWERLLSRAEWNTSCSKTSWNKYGATWNTKLGKEIGFRYVALLLWRILLKSVQEKVVCIYMSIYGLVRRRKIQRKSGNFQVPICM